MARFKLSRLSVAVLVAAALILAAGGAAVASNMGFKLNKALTKVPTPVNGEVGTNWLSIPLFGFTNGTALCASSGLPAGTPLFQINETSGATVNGTCGFANAANIGSFNTGRGVRIRTTLTSLPASIIIVGSHNPAQLVTVPAFGAGDIGSLWFSVPYHTTAITAQDLCNQVGAPAFGASVRIVHPNGVALTPTCGTAAASAATANLVLGEAVRIRTAGAYGAVAHSFTPAHF